LKFITLILIGLAVYRVSLFADDPRLLKRLKKIHESFASAAFASLWIAAAFLLLGTYFEDTPIFRAVTGVFALSGLTCVLSQLHSRPQFLLPLPKFSPPSDRPKPSL
jgi:hypothetical protein